eukprot:s5011_g1.t1
MARQATSTSLGVFTVSIALACTAGGIIYDAYRWQGLSIFHCSCQGSLLLLLLIHPTCRQSFVASFFGDPDEAWMAIQRDLMFWRFCWNLFLEETDDEGIAMKDLQVQPNQPTSPSKASTEQIKTEAEALEQQLPGQTDLVVEDVEDPSRVSKVSFSAAAPEAAEAEDAEEAEGEEETGGEGKKGKVSTVSAGSAKSKMSRVTFGAEEVQHTVKAAGTIQS